MVCFCETVGYWLGFIEINDVVESILATILWGPDFPYQWIQLTKGCKFLEFNLNAILGNICGLTSIHPMKTSRKLHAEPNSSKANTPTENSQSTHTTGQNDVSLIFYLFESLGRNSRKDSGRHKEYRG